MGRDRRAFGAQGDDRSWLCFQTEGEKRRSGLVPREWESMDERELRVLLRTAMPRLRRAPGSPDP
jgi:hypothetical protein